MILYIENDINFRLKLIDDKDIEELRVWKNKNKKSFFLNEDINEKQQTEWFLKYQTDKENFMFVVQERINGIYINIGCMGYRIIDNTIDVYNIMRGIKPNNTKYSMATAFNIMNYYIFKTFKFDIMCKVLLDNPVRSWYELLNFENQCTQNDYVVYKLNTKKLEKINYKKEK